MDTDSLVYDIKTEDFYKDIAEDVETRFDTSGYEPNRPLPIGKNEKVIGLMKDKLGFFLFQILKTYLHAARHARWVLRCLKTAKYVQINETDKT